MRRSAVNNHGCVYVCVTSCHIHIHTPFTCVTSSGQGSNELNNRWYHELLGQAIDGITNCWARPSMVSRIVGPGHRWYHELLGQAIDGIMNCWARPSMVSRIVGPAHRWHHELLGLRDDARRSSASSRRLSH